MIRQVPSQLVVIPTGGDKSRFLDSIIDFNKYFASEEVLLANELWDFLSGDNNTMEQIIQIINAISTPEFMNKSNYIINTQNCINDATNYQNFLSDWFLFREMELMNNNANILRNIRNNKFKKIFNQPVFKDGNYNHKRYDFLKRSFNQQPQLSGQ